MPWTTLRVDDEHKAKLKTLAERQHRSETQVAHYLIDNELKALDEMEECLQRIRKAVRTAAGTEAAQ